LELQNVFITLAPGRCCSLRFRRWTWRRWASRSCRPFLWTATDSSALSRNCRPCRSPNFSKILFRRHWPWVKDKTFFLLYWCYTIINQYCILAYVLVVLLSYFLECSLDLRLRPQKLHIMENLMVIRVEVIAPEKPSINKHLQKYRLCW